MNDSDSWFSKHPFFLESVEVATVAGFLRTAGQKLVRGVDLFEVYRGERLPAGFSVASASVRREFVRARKEYHNQQLTVAAYPNQSSGMLSSACWADGLAVVPEHTTVSPGDIITYYSFAELLG